MRTITTTVYTFDELSEGAKKNAVNKLYDINVSHDWWESTYYDAKTVGIKINGFDIDRGSYVQFDFINSAYDTAQKIIKEHGQDCQTYKDAEQFIKEWDALVCKYSDGVKTDIVTQDNEYDFDSEVYELEQEYKKDIENEYLKMLRSEYEYLTSEEAIIETIQSNEYELTESGKLI